MTDLSAFRAHWTEKRPRPLEMTDTEILDFLDEYFLSIFNTDATPTTPRIVTFMSDVIDTTKAGSVREAVCLAAAKFKEANT